MASTNHTPPHAGRTGGIGKIFFWPLSRSFRPLGLLHYFHRKRQIYTISHSPELSIYFDLKTPMHLAGWAQLSQKNA
jgi:hypothetical protein